MAGALRCRSSSTICSASARLVRSASGIGAQRGRAGTAAPPARSRRRQRAPWTEADLALVDEADSLLGPVEAARPVTRRRNGSGGDAYDTAERVIDDLGLRGYRRRGHARRPVRRPADNGNGSGHDVVVRAPHLRARARRRGAGPHRDAVAHAGPAVPVGVDDAGRRPRPGEQARRGRVVGRRARAPPHPQRNPLRLAEHQLPHAVRGDGRRIAAARRRRTHGRTVACRSAARASTRSFVDVARDDLVQVTTKSTRAALARTGAVAVIAPPASARGDRRVAGRRRRGGDRRRRARRTHRGPRPHERQGPRVRPRDRRRAVAAGERRIGPGSACSTSRSPARRRHSPSSTPKPSPRA